MTAILYTLGAPLLGIAGGLTRGVTNFRIAPGTSVPPGIAAAIASSTPNSLIAYSVSAPALLNFEEKCVA